MSKQLELTDTVNDTSRLVVNADELTVEQFERFSKLGGAGDLTVMRETFALIVKSWDYEGDPSNPDNYKVLPLKKFMALSREISALLGEALKAGN